MQNEISEKMFDDGLENINFPLIKIEMFIVIFFGAQTMIYF